MNIYVDLRGKHFKLEGYKKLWGVITHERETIWVVSAIVSVGRTMKVVARKKEPVQ